MQVGTTGAVGIGHHSLHEEMVGATLIMLMVSASLMRGFPCIDVWTAMATWSGKCD